MSADGAGAGAALVRAAWTAGRAEPDRRAEMVTQWLSGQALTVEEEGPERWLWVRGPDGYRSWVDGGGLVRTDADEASAWAERATVFSLGTDLAPAPGERAGPSPPRWLPWGGLAASEGDGRLEVAGGARVRPVEPAALVADRADRFPRAGEAVVRTAWRWLGIPYLWGGRTREGVDCSGLVQAVFAAHRIELPRDSGLQRDAVVGEAGGGSDEREVEPDGPEVEPVGPEVEPVGSEVEPGGGQGEPGDLLFFASADGDVDHVALRVDGTRVLHAAAGNGQVGEDDLAADGPMGRRLRERLVAVGRPLAE